MNVGFNFGQLGVGRGNERGHADDVLGYHVVISAPSRCVCLFKHRMRKKKSNRA